MKIKKMSILFWDIETLPNIATVWGFWEQNINAGNVIRTGAMECASWKYDHKPKIYSAQVEKAYDDKALCIKLKEILEGVDVVVHHNGDKFDLKYLNTRLLFHGIAPLPKIQTVDTYKVAKSKFRLNSNKLSYLAEILGVEQKGDIGFKAWMGCINNDKKSRKEMLTYNKQDVVVLEAVYYKLLPFITAHPNHNLYTHKLVCSNCGLDSIQKRGYSFTKTGKRQRYQCTDCGAWSTSGKSITTVDVRSQ